MGEVFSFPHGRRKAPVVIVCGFSRLQKKDTILSFIREAGVAHSSLLDADEWTQVPPQECALDWYSDRLVTEICARAEQDRARWIVVNVHASSDLRDLLDALLLPVGRDSKQLPYRIHAVLACVESKSVSDLTAIDVSESLAQAELLVAQLEHSDWILLHRNDSASLTEELVAYDLIQLLQPRAVVTSDLEKLSAVRSMMTRQLFDEEVTMTSSQVSQARLKMGEPSTERLYFEWANRPFHPTRFSELMERWPRNLLRVEGCIWMAHLPQKLITFSQVARDLVIMGEDGEWDDWFLPHTEFSIVGENLDSNLLKGLLEECLLKDHELHFKASDFTNPFPELTQDNGQWVKPHLELVPSPQEPQLN